MSTPSLLSLPAEVRLNIYSFLFADECLSIDPPANTSQLQTKQHRQPALAPILRTCRYLRDEASPSYFSKVKVHFNVRKGVPPTSLIHWMDSIGEANVKLLRNLNMRWENYVDISLELKRNAHAVSKDMTRRTSLGTPALKAHGQMSSNNVVKAAAVPIEVPSIMLGTQLLFKAPAHNPTSSTQVGQRHILTMKGVPTSADREAYWRSNGTAEFCDTLTRYLSPRISATLENRGLYMSSGELVEFIGDASSHAASMRWLWYW